MSRRFTAFLRATLLGLALLMVPAAATQAQQPQPAQPAQPQSSPAQPPRSRPPMPQDEFVPVNDLPDSEKLPAAPYLIAAYTIVWLVLLGYVWSLWRRLSQVEQELQRAVQSAGRPE